MTGGTPNRSREAGGQGATDWGLLAVVTAMLVFGLVTVLSASYPNSVEWREQPFYYFGRQVIWLALGIAAMLVLARIPYTFWERWAVPMMAVTLVALFVLMFVGAERFGSTRTFLNGSIQPSEIAKVIIIVYIAAWLASKGNRIRDVRAGLLPFGVLLGLLTLLIVLQPAISTAGLIVATAVTMFFIAGAAVRQIMVVAAGVIATFWVVIQFNDYAGARIAKYWESFWNPVSSQEYQVQQTVQAFMRGGPVGVGVGQGLAQQTGFVPLAWTDNIYAVVGEELGLLGALVVVLLFALLAYRGLRVAIRCRDPFGTLLATGITTMLTLQALLNAAVVVAAVPPTGVTLPFFSYGGSSMLMALAAVGLLLSVSRYGRVRGARATSPVSPAAPARSGAGEAARPAGSTSHASTDFGWRHRGTRVSGAGRGSTTQSASTRSGSSRGGSGARPGSRSQ
jgi:cell division protein FtsW